MSHMVTHQTCTWRKTFSWQVKKKQKNPIETKVGQSSTAPLVYVTDSRLKWINTCIQFTNFLQEHKDP